MAPYAKITFSEEGSPEDKVTLTREGKAYVAKTKDGALTMRFMAAGDDLYVAESATEHEGQTVRLYGVVRLDAAKHQALTYKTMARAGDIGPGLPACTPGKTNSVCIEDVDAYVALAKAAIAAGAKPDTIYDVTLE